MHKSGIKVLLFSDMTKSNLHFAKYHFTKIIFYTQNILSHLTTV